MKQITNSLALGILTLAAVATAAVLSFKLQPVKNVYADSVCQTENADCDPNQSDKLCCAGLTCVPKTQGNGNKCVVSNPTSTPTPTPTPTVTPTPTPTPEQCDPREEDCVTPTATPTPTPTQAPGNPGNPGGPGDGLSDGRSDGRSSCPSCTQAPQGQVLGATTEFASTGVVEDMIMNAVGVIGGLSTAAGIILKKRFTN